MGFISHGPGDGTNGGENNKVLREPIDKVLGEVISDSGTGNLVIRAIRRQDFGVSA